MKTNRAEAPAKTIEGFFSSAPYEQAIESFFGKGRAYAFWKGRVALYAILKAMGIGPGDEVIVPGYTCVMVPGPILYLGARPIYVDIDSNSYNVIPELVEERMTPHTRSILVQHTYGFPADIKRIREIADRRNIPIIEDCCHVFGGRLDGELLGTFGTAAFFSGQWNKPFSTGLGGIALVQDARLAERVHAEQQSYSKPSAKAALMLACQILIHELIVFPATAARITLVFRWLTRQGLVIGSSAKSEFSVRMPERYALRSTWVQNLRGRDKVNRIAENIAHRKRVAETYRSELPALGYSVPVWTKNVEPVFLRFPVRVANKKEAVAKAVEYGVEIGSWFECPLHPAETDQAAFGYREGQCPVAEKAAREVINLPTHQRVGEKDIEKTLRFLRDVCRPA